MEIVNEKDFIQADSRMNLIKISSNEITIINVTDIYDGPLSGKCEWRGGQYYFYCFDQLLDDGDSDRWPRKYILIELSSEQNADYDRSMSQFEDWWVKHLITKEQYSEMNKDRKEETIDKDQIVGWFDLGESGTSPDTFLESYFAWQKRTYKNNENIQ